MKQVLLTVLVAVVSALGAVALFGGGDAVGVAAKETAYERVVKTGVLRCGYGPWVPMINKNVNTGEMEGLFVELMRAAGELGGFKVEWVQETDWGTVGQDLQQGKIDAHCAGMWPNANRGRQIIFSKPLVYMPVGFVVRKDDIRFPTGRPMRLEELNKPAFTVGFVEGDVTEAVAKVELPMAKRYAAPPMTVSGDAPTALAARKYDLIASPKVMVDGMIASGSDNIRYLVVDPAPRVYGTVNAFASGEQDLRDWVDAAITELASSARYARIVASYEAKYPHGFIRPSQAYKEAP